MGARDLRVTVSGEGDFEMTTDCAWEVLVVAPDGTAITVTHDPGDGSDVGVLVNDEVVWSKDCRS